MSRKPSLIKEKRYYIKEVRYFILKIKAKENCTISNKKQVKMGSFITGVLQGPTVTPEDCL